MSRFIIFIAMFIATILPALVAAEERIYPGYTFHSLGNGIYVHSQDDPLAGPADGNSTIIVSDGGVLVVDTHINPAATRAVIGRIRELSDEPVTHVINTHWHDDHTNGNYVYRQVFPDVKIVAHPSTLAAMQDGWPEMENQRISAYASVNLEELRAAADQLEQEDPDTAFSYRIYAGYVEALRPELDVLKLAYPDTLFDDSLLYQFGERDILLKWLGPGNTDGDVVVWLPAEKMLITGDLVVAPVPYAFDSPVTDWVVTLNRIAELEIDVLVPGHGAIQRDKQYLMRVMALLQDTSDAVRDAHDQGSAFSDLPTVVNLRKHELAFTNGDAKLGWAWRNYYLGPVFKSTWTSLGYALPEED